jgi:hypothetical protein
MFCTVSVPAVTAPAALGLSSFQLTLTVWVEPGEQGSGSPAAVLLSLQVTLAVPLVSRLVMPPRSAPPAGGIPQAHTQASKAAIWSVSQAAGAPALELLQKELKLLLQLMSVVSMAA